MAEPFNPLQDLLSILNAVISTNERTDFITGHVIFMHRYNQNYQLKTTHVFWFLLFTKLLVHPYISKV